jgi:hypothetical protein
MIEVKEYVSDIVDLTIFDDEVQTESFNAMRTGRSVTMIQKRTGGNLNKEDREHSSDDEDEHDEGDEDEHDEGDEDEHDEGDEEEDEEEIEGNEEEETESS